MTLRFRTNGPWGAGIGADLTAAQIDENFYTLDQKIDAKPDAVAIKQITSITQTGSKLTVHYSDTTTDGPFQMPIAVFQFRGEYVPGDDYDALDMILVSDADNAVAEAQLGLYLVLQDIATDPEDLFDPGATAGGDPVYFLVVPLIDVTISLPPVVFGANITASRGLVVDDANKYFRCTGAGLVEITVPPNSEQEFNPGDVIEFKDVSGNQVSIVEGVGVTVDTPGSTNRASRAINSRISITYEGGDVWTLAGDLEIV